MRKALRCLKKPPICLLPAQRAKDRLVSPLPGQAEYLDLLRAVRDLREGTKADPLEILNSVKPFLLEKQSETRP